MPIDPPALRRARRRNTEELAAARDLAFVLSLLAGLASVQLGSLTRDLERLDQVETIPTGEMALRRAVNVRLASRLLRERGFARCGWNGGSGLHREPVYSLGHRPD